MESPRSPRAHDLELNKTGYMYKKGGKLTSKWQRRWFELNAAMGTLEYYEKQGDKNKKGELVLNHSVLEDVEKESYQAFKIKGNLRTDKPKTEYLIGCETEEDKDSWMQALHAVHKMHTKH
eukprot:TRINITY_DN68081_c2_g1_i1.p1 TRINITY_DN68081_c2_g1~~TRINITY_DN68081_c2_g1_i1.p1  ORF type:complete len:121 (+),score=7.45 TRINITY_DN68081_c2_g1_i1:36-398(+)